MNKRSTKVVIFSETQKSYIFQPVYYIFTRMKSKITLLLLAVSAISCAPTKKSVQSVNITDSLTIISSLGKLEERIFQGILPAASCPGIEYTIWLYNQRNSGDGVYKLTQRYIEAEDGEDMTILSFGKQYTLRGDAEDLNATVYQLIPFTSTDTLNLLYTNGNLEMLNRNFERAKSKLNYTLQRQ